MEDYQREFIQFAISQGVLKFGEFELKSGRISPYFFNAGLFYHGSSLSKLGKCYASAIQNSKLDYDVIFGPAYKGIPLASAAAMYLNDSFNLDKPFSYNRKEKKDHGEGGTIVGAPLNGRILIIDDVITAGTAIRESLDMISKAGAQPAGVIVAVDREERGKGELSAIQELAKERGLPVFSIVTMSQIILYLKETNADPKTIESMEKYLATYKAKSD
ncbi:orotate phosphoribosyltransferase [Conidiobolus coronatus NRRL 28638]|jgi:orotate phosphoribosyltransferase|uniref:orotate phosphoribosyltransferase n=1 Tax=Conidiobolus coronatus (strain ATCC 28846 / CBS 209.66 / NRRL 28638) TaxID=796925 RepID=A0A137NX35_CONC2|nr:orotate phosphoribosyltransferase [Conidiobolus coronatus NRRL 28638]|eukprot:KXN67258.1 orotate phosphoribosyltransferase [Conidiobolus coronatus NRRL 28638]